MLNNAFKRTHLRTEPKWTISSLMTKLLNILLQILNCITFLIIQLQAMAISFMPSFTTSWNQTSSFIFCLTLLDKLINPGVPVSQHQRWGRPRIISLSSNVRQKTTTVELKSVLSLWTKTVLTWEHVPVLDKKKYKEIPSLYENAQYKKHLCPYNKYKKQYYENKSLSENLSELFIFTSVTSNNLKHND